MKIQFDANQQFQLDAVASIADLFDGQPQGAPEFSVIKTIQDTELFAGQERSELGLGNRLLLDDAKLQANTRLVQSRNEIEVSDGKTGLEGWEVFDPTSNAPRICPHFSVEMETGTGKTYVYLRTVFELSRRYGFKKFIIVVPSVAIREGVLKNIDITSDHFRALYDNAPFQHFVYDARRVNKLRQFATGNTLQILIINIDAFRKNFTGTEAEQKSNVIYKESDKLSGRQPIEFVQAARPIVIIDEPQSVDSTEKAQEAIKALNPLCTLRYSATHKNPYNLVYRLDPVRAFELRLVKQIVVASAATTGGANNAFIRVESIDYKPSIKAKVRIHVQGGDGPKERSVTLKNGDDLFVRSNERAAYAQNYSVAEINAEPDAEFIRFANGLILRIGQEVGGMRDDVWRVQIRHTVKKHLDKELQLHNRGIKVLSLFFIDRVASYRDYDTSGNPIKGKFAEWFEEELKALLKQPQYNVLEWTKQPLEKLHNGYFAQDKKGVFKDTKGDTQADDDVYNLIMRDKEQLLSIEEPLRFIFSHSALREGWDNPNVFQICTLNETKSAMKKRQEIGRGLRLPVDQDGKRVFDETINKLYVMANESYEDFARALQTEYEEDCGVAFGKVPLTALARITRAVDGEEVLIGKDAAEAIRQTLVAQKMLETDGRLGKAFDPKAMDFKLTLPPEYADLEASVVDLLAGYQIERHIRKDTDEKPNKLRKEVTLTDDFKQLWDRIKPKTAYRIEFETDTLVARAVAAIKKMEKVEAPKIKVIAGRVEIRKGGVAAEAVSAADEQSSNLGHGVPDILAYLQNETELTRSTLVRILKDSRRLGDFLVNPQRFMDQVALILKYELHRLLVDGIKYDRIGGTGPDSEWEMVLFKNEELVNVLTALQVKKSIYNYVVYDSEVEREFAQKLDQREDIRLFVKLPDWFKVETPVGTYNPDWAIVKHQDETIYLVRETKGTKDFLKLRTTEADKVRCGQRHFEALGVPFAVVTSTDDV
ncbi:DEAD/DEAH box helicase family protein [Bradyrhizobium sp. SZCCHNR2032]|uniref:restriction endonuclease n=1 Tax=Bradyrhizobium sp. SZCCHNR2032 TaxID=3057384 RepID=UPI002915D7B8|nr:DEAD/DEAH box helicase family protein [Bradyrhizobium sp. SZCCHNR2032]